MELKFKLEVFEGPLDLLLHLIEKNKLDIYDIPIAQITDQYVAYVREMAKNDLDIASEFLVMAAQLLMIKSKMLLPKPEETEEETDPELLKEELTKRLLELKMIKYLSGKLRLNEEDGRKRFFGYEDIPPEVLKYRPAPDLDRLMYGMDVNVLNRAFGDALRRAAERKDPIRSRFGTIEAEKVDVQGRVRNIKTVLKAKLQKDKKLKFNNLLDAGGGVLSEIVTFLVLLEMMRGGYISAFQERVGEEIDITVLKDPESFGESGEFL